MTINFNLSGKARTALAKAISQELNTEATYVKGKTHAYIIGEYTVGKDGVLTGPFNETLVANLRTEHGFEPTGEDWHDEENAAEPTETAPTLDQHYQGAYNKNPEPTESGNDSIEGVWMNDPCTGPVFCPLPAADETPTTEANETAAGETPTDTEPQATDEAEYRTYRAELSDPDISDRMEIFGATNDFEAVKQAYEFCTEGVFLLELHELDTDFNLIKCIDIEANKPRLTIMVPLDGWSPEKIDNLCKMVTAKEELLKAALGAPELPIQIDHELEGGQIKFPWFWSAEATSGEEAQAYSHLVHLLCETAKEKKRVTAKAGEMPANPKYAMRCFLLSLGMVGDEYKISRKILLSKLSGNSSWRDGRPETTAPTTETAEAEA